MGACFDAPAPPVSAGELIIVSVAALVDSDNRILLARRPPHKELPDLWEFPGGKLQAGETPEQALLRELHEELAIETAHNCLAPAGFSSHAYEKFHACVLLFVCRQWRGVAQSAEGQELQWVPLLSLPDYPQPPANAHLCALLRDLL